MADERVIRFYRKCVYGNDLLYPVDFKEAITKLTGKIVLTDRCIAGLELLGFSFVEVLESSIIKEVADERIFSGR